MRVSLLCLIGSLVAAPTLTAWSSQPGRWVRYARTGTATFELDRLSLRTLPGGRVQVWTQLVLEQFVGSPCDLDCDARIAWPNGLAAVRVLYVVDCLHRTAGERVIHSFDTAGRHLERYDLSARAPLSRIAPFTAMESLHAAVCRAGNR